MPKLKPKQPPTRLDHELLKNAHELWRIAQEVDDDSTSCQAQGHSPLKLAMLGAPFSRAIRCEE